MALSKEQKHELEQRRAFIARLYARRLTQREIRAALAQSGTEVSLATVNRDISIIENRWQREAEEELAALRARELGELNEMERQCASQQGVEWIRERRHIKERKARMLGLDAPQRTDVTSAGEKLQGGALISDERADELVGLLREAVQQEWEDEEPADDDE